MILNLLKIVTFSCIVFFGLNSCATLNKDECRNANWKLIGFEDGSRGLSASRIGQHRSACAKYGITPDLNLYNKGRAEGLHKYCVPDIAYQAGKQDQQYTGTCFGYNEQAFIHAFRQGKKLYSAKINLQDLHKMLELNQDQLTKLKQDIHDKEQQIVSGKLTPSEVVLSLVDIKRLAQEQGALMNVIRNNQDNISHQKSLVTELKQQYRY